MGGVIEGQVRPEQEPARWAPWSSNTFHWLSKLLAVSSTLFFASDPDRKWNDIRDRVVPSSYNLDHRDGYKIRSPPSDLYSQARFNRQFINASIWTRQPFFLNGSSNEQSYPSYVSLHFSKIIYIYKPNNPTLTSFSWAKVPPASTKYENKNGTHYAHPNKSSHRNLWTGTNRTVWWHCQTEISQRH